MGNLRKTSDIWQIMLESQDIQKGIDYGIISRAWTYDRMGAQAKGNFGKAIFRISVGRAIQNALERKLGKFGVVFERDTTDYKEEDYWDIRTQDGKSVDLKSFHVFTDYEVKGRGPLSSGNILQSSAGDNWANFFPMLIPVDQFNAEPKDYYIFAILAAPQSKRIPNVRLDARYLISLPFSKDKYLNEGYHRLHRRKYADQRVEQDHTFSLDISLVAFFPRKRSVTIGYGDNKGNACRKELALFFGKTKTLNGLTALHFLRLHGTAEENLILSRKEVEIFRIVFKNVEEYGDMEWRVLSTSFEDIWIYEGKVYFIGWIAKEDFEEARKRYNAFGPRKDYKGNAGYWDKNEQGLLSIRSFCYFYPPVFWGGTKNPNYYCLPIDLQTMDTLVAVLKRN